MKILAVSHEFPPIGGGGANACYFLTKGFVEKGHEVTLVTARYQGLPEKETVNGVEVIRVDCKRKSKEQCSFKEMLSYLLKAMPVADKLQKQRQYDICLVFFGIPSGPIGYRLKKKYKLPYVIRFGGGDVPGFQERFTKVYRLIGPAIKSIWKRADARIVNSEGLKRLALDFYDKAEFGIIHNGVDEKMFKPVAKMQKEEVFRVLFLSRLIERKGLQHVIPQLKNVVETADRKVELVVVGDGPYRKELERIVSEQNLNDYVKFEGQKNKEEIIPYYQNADVFIFPSRKEGMPNVVLEAMACGLPIIMTPCEGSDELIDGNGYVVNKNDFGKMIELLIKDEDGRRLLGERSRKKIEDAFSWESVVHSYLQTLEGI